jgi:predicted dienelactone hydrolase
MTAGAFMFIAIAALAANESVPAQVLPAPDGKYAVGVVRTEFVDPSRRLDADDAASGPRRLPAIVWYPSRRRAADGEPYMSDDVAALTLPAIARNFRYAPEDLQSLADLRMKVRAGAPPARGTRGFPVVVFSHGFFLYPEQNSALASRLASHGYIVVSIAHPGDAADVRLEDGRVVATKPASDGDDPRFAQAFKTLVGGADLAVRREALAGYAEAFVGTRLGRSFAEWRDDTLVVAHAILEGTEPRSLREVMVTADRGRLVFAGMSFGGATAATSCRLVNACRAAVNLDGQNFDPQLFDRPVGRPLLLMLSDWTRYGLFEGQPREADFSPNDLAYESWSEAGQNRDVVRVRLEGARHVGYTDLVALLVGPKRQERVGDIDGDEALSAIGDLVLAFLHAYVGDGAAPDIGRAIERHHELKHHVPTRLQGWMGKQP